MGLKFQDKLGREWDCTIDVPTIERLIDNKTCDLYGALDNEMKLYKSIMKDPRQLMGTVWAIIEPQAAAMSPPVTILDWRLAIDGDTIEAMGEAFTLALANFSPALKKSLILKGWEKGKKLEALSTNKGHAMLDKVDPEDLANKKAVNVESRMNKALQDFIDGPSDASSGDTSASSASSPLPE